MGVTIARETEENRPDAIDGRAGSLRSRWWLALGSWCEGASCGCSAVCRSDNSVPPLNAEVANIDAM